MRTLIFLIIMFWSCQSQPKTINIPTDDDGRMSLWYSRTLELIDEINLDDLLQTKDFRFRLWTMEQVISVTDNSTTVISFAIEYDENDYQKMGKLHSETVKIDAPTHSRFLALLKSSGIIKLPSEEHIVDWGQGADGIIYAIEHSTASEYNFRTYWSPDMQPELPEAVLVENFIQKTSEILDLKMIYGQFFNKLPSGCYNNGDIITMCKE